VGRPYTIRMLGEQELSAALELAWRVFEAFEAPEYTPAWVEVFLEFIGFDTMLVMLRDGDMKFWGCFDADTIIGMLAVRAESHISLLFVQKEYDREGIGRSLFEAFRSTIKDPAPRITVHSSPYAVGFYRRLGFRALGAEQTADGIRFTPMAYE